MSVFWQGWIRNGNEYFLTELLKRRPDMAAIINEYRKARRMALPKHEVIERDGNRFYERMEHGVVRKLRVWTQQSCNEKIAEKLQAGGREAVSLMFREMSKVWGSYLEPQADPMLGQWFGECFEEMERAWEKMEVPVIEDFGAVAPVATIEDFGAGVIEDFGV